MESPVGLNIRKIIINPNFVLLLKSFNTSNYTLYNGLVFAAHRSSLNVNSKNGQKSNMKLLFLKSALTEFVKINKMS
jgi:hypothetical protein